MLTCKSVSPKKAVSYFLEGYYQKGSSRWFGKGAEKLGLSGEITDKKAFQNIAQGYSPDRSQHLVGKSIPKEKRRAAVDCTLSAPKSVSLTALVAGDKGLITAHHIAVEKTLILMQERYAHTRVRDGENRNIVNTGNLVVAQFDHIETRELDPHLHTHCLVMNMTELASGKWYSHLNEGIYANKKMLGMAYQNYLAAEVQKLGYSVEWKQHGQFDIVGYTEQDLVEFSKRRVQILAAAGSNSSWLEREKAWDATRQCKTEFNPETLIAKWQQEARALGIKFAQPVQSKPVELEQSQELQPKVSQKILDSAIKHCSEREVAFKLEKLEEFILEQDITVDITQLEPLLRQHPELIRIPEKNGVRYTTQAALQRELATIRLMQSGKGALSAIAREEVINAQLENTSLNAGQRKAVILAATTTDLFIAWQGVAGAGKTYAVEKLKAIAQQQGYKFIGFAPSAQAAKVLSDEAKIETNTVAGLLASKSTQQISPKQIWIVDEAGLLSAKDAYALLQRATNEQARVILIGDTRQLSAVEAGNPFKSLQQTGISTAYLDESQRQKKAPELKVAVDLIASGKIAAGFEQLKSNKCIKTVTADTKIGLIASDYMAVPTRERDQVLMLAGTNAERLELTQTVRSKLFESGSLGASVNISQLKARDLTTVQMEYTNHFVVGDVVMPLRSYKRRGLNQGELYEVIASYTDHLQLKGSDGKVITTDAGFKKAVYQQHKIEIAVGDRLKWTKNERTIGRRNGQEFTVSAISGNSATIQYLESDRTETINLDLAQHLDYALVSTTYSSQGKTADQVLIAADSTIGKESFYVAVSRARFGLKLYTENPDKLLELAELSRAKENVLDVLRSQIKQQVETKATAHKEPALNSITTAKPSKGAHTASPIVPPVSPPKQSTTPASSVKPSTPTRANKPTPKLIEAFWTPTPAGVPPRQIEEKHWRELVEGSAINPALVEPNVYSVSGRGVDERLLSTKLEKIGGSGQYVTQPAAKLIKAYEQVASGGWWAESGIDALSLPNLTPGEKPLSKLWGCFKADNPRVDADKSQRKGETAYIKYEHPLAEERQLFLFNIPDALAQCIYDKYGIQPTDAEKQSGFWYVVYKYNLPITLAEGAKKTLSSLSQGEITIGLSGVNGGYFALDRDKNRLEQRVLHPELKIFATRSREFRFAFDQDTKESTVWNVRREMVRTGELLELEGSIVRVTQWQGDKGLDDLIVNQSPFAYAMAIANSIPLLWEAQKHYRAQYSKLSKKVLSNQPDLSDAAVDIEVYKQACLKGDLRDGATTIAQSDTVRLFKANLPEFEATEKTRDYLKLIEKSVFGRGRQPQLSTEIRDAANSVAPKNLNPDERTEPLIDKLTGQQPLNIPYLNQPDEYNHGDDTQESQHDIPASRNNQNRRDGLVDREDRADGSQHNQTDDEDRPIREQQQPDLRAGQQSGIQPNRKPERVEGESQQLSTATNGHLEQQEAEPDRAVVEGINRSSTDGRLPSRIAAEFSGALERQNSASPNSTASHGGIERQTRVIEQQITRQCLDALASYTAAVSVESQKLSQTLQALANNLRCYQPLEGARVMQELEPAILNEIKQPEKTQADEQTLDALANYLTAEVVETALAQNLEDLTRQISKFSAAKTTQISSQKLRIREQAIDAIANYTQIEALAAPTLSHLSNLKQQLSSLLVQGNRQATPTIAVEHPLEKALNAIAGYVEQKKIESALSQNLESLTKQLHQLTKWGFVLDRKQYSHSSEQVINAISHHITLETVESSLAQNLESLTLQLNTLSKPSIQLKQPFIHLIASYTTLEAEINKNSPSPDLTAIEAINNHIESAAVEDELTPLLQALIELTKQLQTTSSEQTNNQTIDAIARSVEQSAIESGIDSQTLQTLSNRLCALHHPLLTAQTQQLEAIVKDFSKRLQTLALTQAVERVAEARGSYHEHLAIDDAITQELQRSVQDLARLGESALPKQLQQLEGAIKQYRQQIETRPTTVQLVPQVFMGSQPQPDLLQPIQNHGQVYKPAGGMWTSPYQPQYGSEWSAFVHKEGMTVPPHKQHLWLVVPKPDLKILVVDSPEKLKSLPHLPPRIIGDRVCPLDYEVISTQYDALVIKPQMLRGCMEVASFDIESTIWFGSSGYPFASVEPLTLPKVQQQASLPTVDSSPNQSSTLTSKNNGQASVGESETVKNLEKWKLVALALGKPQAYFNRVAATTKAVKTGLPLPENAFPFMQQDFQFYQQISDDLQHWYDAAKDLGKSDQYLSQIKQVAKAFHDPSMPTPLSPKAVSTMQQELQKYEQLQMHSLWQHYSLAVEPVRPMMKANAVAHAALIDGHPTEMIHKLLKHDPQLSKIRLSSGEQAVQNHLKISLQSALSKMQHQNQPHQVYQQHQHKQTPGFEL